MGKMEMGITNVYLLRSAPGEEVRVLTMKGLVLLEVERKGTPASVALCKEEAMHLAARLIEYAEGARYRGYVDHRLEHYLEDGTVLRTNVHSCLRPEDFAPLAEWLDGVSDQ